MNVSEPYILHRLLRALSPKEKKLATESNSNLVKLANYARGFDHAVRLVEHCDTMRAELRRRKSTLISFDTEGRAEISDKVNMVFGWATAAARDAAFNAWHFDLVLAQIEGAAKNRLPLFAAFDRDLLSKARLRFDREFPKVDRMRRAIAYETELSTSENATKKKFRGGLRWWMKQEKGRLLYVVTTFDGRQLQMVHEGESLILDVTHAKSCALVEIKRLIYASFLPVMAKALELMKEQIEEDRMAASGRPEPWSL
jgi:hypothetical protein